MPAGEFDLRGAIDMANILNAAETITFDPSVFSTSQTITVSSTLNLTETAGSEVIDGPGASLVTVSGNNAVTVFSVASGVTSSFSGLTISGGLGGGSTGDNGGGIYNSGTTTVTNAIIEDNSAINAGGGIFNAAGTMTVNDCTIANNTAGGAFVAGGGGIYSGATLTITNSTIDNNVSHTYAGGIFDQGGTGLTVTNSTLAYNVASTDGGGIEVGGTTTLNNTVVALNTLGTGSGATPNDVRIYQSGSLSSASAYNLIGTGGAGGLTTGNHNQIGVANPGLGTLGDYGGPTQTIPLLPGSPAIRAGTSTGAPSTDQRGLSLDSPAPDVGAFQTNPLVVNTTIDGTGSPFGDLSLRQAANLANALGAAETITFSSTVFASTQTITLTSGQLVLSNTGGTQTITGPAAGVMVSGGGKSRVFEVDGGVTASFSGLTITGGNTTGNGGGIENSGTLTLTNSTITGDTASGLGGGLFNYPGSATIIGCTFSTTGRPRGVRLRTAMVSIRRPRR